MGFKLRRYCRWWRLVNNMLIYLNKKGIKGDI